MSKFDSLFNAIISEEVANVQYTKENTVNTTQQYVKALQQVNTTQQYVKALQQGGSNNSQVVQNILKTSNNLPIEHVLVMWNELRKKLPTDVFHELIKTTVEGDIDEGIKKEFLYTVLPKVKRILADR